MATLHSIDVDDEADSVEVSDDTSPSKPKRMNHTLSKGLINAISEGNKDEVEQLLNQTNPSQLNKRVRIKNTGYHSTPLLWAVTNKQAQIGKLLIENGADVNKSGTNENNDILFYFTPLLKAIEHGDENMVKLLIDNGADVNLKMHGPRHREEEGGSMLYVKWIYPLKLALQYGNRNVVNILLERIDLNAIYDEGNRGRHTCLCLAASRLNLGIIQCMISKGAKLCRGEGQKYVGTCKLFKMLVLGIFSVMKKGSEFTILSTDQNKFRCLMSICLTDYTRTGSTIHKTVSQFASSSFFNLNLLIDTKCSQLDESFVGLLPHSSSPSKLKHICRVVIRDTMHRHGKLPDNVGLLPLPKEVERYLMLKEEFDVINNFEFDKAE